MDGFLHQNQSALPRRTNACDEAEDEMQPQTFRLVANLRERTLPSGACGTLCRPLHLPSGGVISVARVMSGWRLASPAMAAAAAAVSHRRQLQSRCRTIVSPAPVVV
eukprot:CAMPEP_0119359280 /NCGR_PEP_ID=MMETSP1334-20130426/7210_1 /TAXON_ID=127549 /ORGANISM="Calcidiscus leptoporus, Strain RCC1130" /LENGTH=106 /DNA_ID=CAMNT_0007373927 /DNA_START=51 /DNA_END=371 /DNA_ORIENTATION=-